MIRLVCGVRSVSFVAQRTQVVACVGGLTLLACACAFDNFLL